MAMQLAMLGMSHPHAEGLVRQVAEHPSEFQFTGFWDPDERVVADRRGRWGAMLGGFPAFARAEDLLAASPDGVVIEGTVQENIAWARRAVEAGLPVMLEKPAGVDVAAHRSLLALAEQKRVRVQMIYLFRYMSAVLKMLELGRTGKLGRIYAFRARLPKDLSLYAAHVEMFAWHPGGIFFEMAGHVIDMMVALLGAPSNVTPFLAHHHEQPGAFVDNGVAVFAYEHAWGIVEVPALEAAPDARRIEVYGTEGACAIPNLGSGHLANDATQPLDVTRAGGDGWERMALPAATLQIADLREFAATTTGRKEPDYSMAHDLTVQETLLRASGVSVP